MNPFTHPIKKRWLLILLIPPAFGGILLASRLMLLHSKVNLIDAPSASGFPSTASGIYAQGNKLNFTFEFKISEDAFVQWATGQGMTLSSGNTPYEATQISTGTTIMIHKWRFATNQTPSGFGYNAVFDSASGKAYGTWSHH